MNRNFIPKKMVIFFVILFSISIYVTPVISTHLVFPLEDEAYKKTESSLNSDEGIYDLLVISPKEFKNCLLPLVEHKENVGISTKLVTLDRVYDEMFWQGRDKPEKIKYFIKNAIEEWGIKYVLLIGGMKRQTGSWHMPVRYSHIDDANMEKKHISDLYFADIYDGAGNFSSWDSNGNGVYGEWTGESAEDGDIDLYPDVYLGRLPCRNRFEVRIMVNKIITYERNTYGKPWFKKIAVVAGDTFRENDIYEGEENSKLVLENMSNFEPIKLWLSDGSLTSSKDVIKAVNQGCGFLYLSGHGTPAVWGTVEFQDSGQKFIYGPTLRNIPLFNNFYKLPICVMEGCANSQFNVTLKNLLINPKESINHSISTWVPECLGWRFTRKIGGGSIATLGLTAEGYAYGHYSSREINESWKGGANFLSLQFFVECGVNNVSNIGEAWSNSIEVYVDTFPVDWDTRYGNISSMDVKTVQTWVLFGDPSLKIGGYQYNC